MKNGLLFLFILLIATACNKSALQKKLDDANGLTLKFFDANNTDSIIKIVKTTDEKAIEKMTGFVDGKKSENLKCSFTGIMLFTNKGTEIQTINFSTKNNCEHFFYNIDGKVISTKMSNEAADFLNVLYSGRNFY